MQKFLQCKKVRTSKVESDYMNRLATTKSDIRIWPGAQVTEHINATLKTLQPATAFKV